jgi:vitamin-K-epoxide reductase (warfarin-sensitive)
VYALHVETRRAADPEYRALCDISESMSCSRVFNSPYGRGFGIVGRVLGHDHPLNAPNSVFGIAVYAAMLLLGGRRSAAGARNELLVTVAVCLGSAYLGYILVVVLQDICVVCMSTYVVNAALLLVNAGRARIASSRTASANQAADSESKRK